MRTSTSPARAVRAAASVLLTLGALGAAKAPLSPGMTGTVTDAAKVFAEPDVPKPGYLAPAIDPQFHTRLLRITNDPGQPVPNVNGAWGTDARHVYSKQQPWNATGTMLSVENRGAIGPHASPLILDGETYQPLFTPCADYDHWDYRWH